MPGERKFLIWSNEHAAWWRSGWSGYTVKIEEAGLYIEFEADQICAEANKYLQAGTRSEVMVQAPEVVLVCS